MAKTQTKQSAVVIIGAGLAGCFLAIQLAKRGIKVEIYEQFSRREIDDNASKRSYTLTMYGYGIQAIHDAGLWEATASLFTKLKGSFTQVTPHSKPIIVHLGEKLPFYAVSRAKLLGALVKQAEKEPLITFHFERSLISINRYEKTMIVQDMQSKKYQSVSCAVIFGADGVHSKVRQAIQYGQMTSHVHEYEPWSYKQIIINKELAEKLQLPNDLSCAWTRKDAIFVAYPNGDKSFSGMLLLPKLPGKGIASLTSPASIKVFLTKQIPDFLAGLPEFTKALLENPEGTLGTIYTTPWYYKGFMAMLGDAAHGFLPFYGQGVSAAFGDGMLIGELLDTYGENWDKIFPLYQEKRKRNTDALAHLSKESFTQYRRHKKADYSAIYNKIDTILYKFFPGFFHPPAFQLVAADQSNTAVYYARHQKQRRQALFLGIPLIVFVMTGLVALYEGLEKLRKGK